MEMKAELIAPCGMNCRLCYAYIRTQNPCGGCRSTNGKKPKSCAECSIVLCEARCENGWDSCAFCTKPCRRLKDLDKRYRAKYHMSMLENLETVRAEGMEGFLRKEDALRRCAACGEVLCVHKRECPGCHAPAWEAAPKDSLK